MADSKTLEDVAEKSAWEEENEAFVEELDRVVDMALESSVYVIPGERNNYDALITTHGAVARRLMRGEMHLTGQKIPRHIIEIHKTQGEDIFIRCGGEYIRDNAQKIGNTWEAEHPGSSVLISYLDFHGLPYKYLLEPIWNALKSKKASDGSS